MNKFDILLLVLGFLIVVGIFTLAFVIYFKGGNCVVDPIKYMVENNITIPYKYQVQILP